MNFRIFELMETEKFQYLGIHKNGSRSVMDCIFSVFTKEEVSVKQHLATDKPRFCIIRDPYERFISGLRYDLLRHNVNFKDINIKKLFTTNENHVRNTIRQNVKHSISQIPYIMNVRCSHYIDMEDLNIFLKMHFNKTSHLNKFEKKNKYYNIEKYLDKDEIMKYLHLDYYIYNSIKNSPFLWEWQHGRIFE
jgi:hypothetical protein